jgi:hypothetical protein
MMIHTCAAGASRSVNDGLRLTSQNAAVALRLAASGIPVHPCAARGSARPSLGTNIDQRCSSD